MNSTQIPRFFLYKLTNLKFSYCNMRELHEIHMYIIQHLPSTFQKFSLNQWKDLDKNKTKNAKVFKTSILL